MRRISSAPVASVAPVGEADGFPRMEQPRRQLSAFPTLLPALCALIALFSLAGIGLALWLRTTFAGYPDPRSWFNAFYVLFARHEVAGLSVVALFYATAAAMFLRLRNSNVETLNKNESIRDEQSNHLHASNLNWESSNLFRISAFGFRIFPLFIALIVFAIASIGTSAVFHDYHLTADENLADFQARIFLRGKIQTEVPREWVEAVPVIKPTFVSYFPATHLWNGNYLPVYAAMRAAFMWFGLQSLLNPLLAAVAVVALYGTARNVWPESPLNSLVAAGLLASSSQVLLMSMTGYAMPAHLALNMIWLWLYSRPDRRAFYLAPFIGVLAIGLHQPIVHALFVLPFLIRLVIERRWRAVFVYAPIYLLGCAAWFAWKTHFEAPAIPGVGGLRAMFRLANPRMAVIQPMNLWLIIGWSSLAMPLLAFLGFKNVWGKRPIFRDAALSCALTFGFYYFFYLDQAHGWGYRYFYGALGCFTLVAVAGFERLLILIGQRRALVFTASGIALSMLVQLPLRCVQAESFVRPYAGVAEAFRNVPANIVAFNPCDAWYSADLIRNDPFLEQRPVIVSLLGLTEEALPVLEKNGPARIVPAKELANMGLSTFSPNHYGRDPFHLGRGN
jgi:hypothetical protein